jgi:DNA-binding XRE family transcriptional regulator
MVKDEKKVPKMSVIKLTAAQIAKKAGVSKQTVESTMTGRRTNKKVVATVKELNEGIEKLLKH